MMTAAPPTRLSDEEIAHLVDLREAEARGLSTTYASTLWAAAPALLAEVVASRAEIAELRAALEPFVNGVKVELGHTYKMVRCDVFQEHFDRARAALRKTKEPSND